MIFLFKITNPDETKNSGKHFLKVVDLPTYGVSRLKCISQSTINTDNLIGYSNITPDNKIGSEN